MLNHRNTLILFIVLLAVLLGVNSINPISIFWFVLLVLLFLGIEFYGAAYVQSGFHIKSYSGIDTSEKVVSITFDDGPLANKTEKILAVLKKYEVKATFFCIGNRISGNENILLKIDAEGHVIGNHSYSHSFLYDMNNTKQMIADIETGNEEIKKVIGKTPVFFRPPYGVLTPSLARACKFLKLDVIGWNIRSLDTKIKDKKELVTRVKKRIKPGAIILFHDSVDGIEIALEEILNYLKEKNYKVIALPNLINKEAYA